MQRRKVTYLIVVILVLALSGAGIYVHLLSSASQGNDAQSGGSSTRGHPVISNQHFAIGTDFPLSGADGTAGLSAQYGVDAAVSQNVNLGNGNTLTVVHMDDEGANGPDPAKGAANVQHLIANPQVMAIVGPANSNVAAFEIPLVETSGIVEISPSDTSPGLTVKQYASRYAIDFSHLHPAGSQEYYFRVAGNDVVEGKVIAQLALQQLQAKTAFVVDDDTAYGKGLADFFTQAFTAGGGKIVGSRASISPSQVANLGGLGVAINGDHPDVVFYGGVTSPDGVALKQALVQAGFQHPLIAGNDIAANPSFTHEAGSAAANTYAIAASPDISSLTSATGQNFLNTYEMFEPGEPVLPYSAMSYDAAMVEISAIKSLLAKGIPVTRDSLRSAVAASHYGGVSGQISFDANGDVVHPVFSVYATDPAGNWVFEHLVQV